MKQYDEYQSAILEHPTKAGSCLIVKASAGSGKTTTVVGKIKKLIESGIISSSILSTAFNNRAAKELKQRFREDKIPMPNTSTLHGFGRFLLNTYFDLKPTIMTEWNSLVCMRDVLESELDGDFKKSELTPLAKELLDVANTLRTIRKYNTNKIANGTFLIHNQIETNLDMTNTEICNLLNKYETIKRATNTIDYADMLHLPLTLLEQDSNALSKVKADIRYYFIDECLTYDTLVEIKYTKD